MSDPQCASYRPHMHLRDLSGSTALSKQQCKVHSEAMNNRCETDKSGDIDFCNIPDVSWFIK